MTLHTEYWLAAAHAGIAPRYFWEWLTVFPDIKTLYTSGTEVWCEYGIAPAHQELLRQPNWQAVEHALAWRDSSNTHHIVTYADADYSDLLKEISDPPLVLFVKGRPALLKQRQIGVVGSRRISLDGEYIAHYFGKALSLAGYVITSGLALGVDAYAHKGALEGRGPTIAVMGTGVQQLYPPQHKKLAEEIVAKGGALVSEFPVSEPPKHFNFPRRNRIISGLSQGVLVVEAALRSGSLVTARHAVEQGREVFAIPGSIRQKNSHGCHALIRQGAKLVQSPEDILEEFSGDFPTNTVEISSALAIMPETLTAEEQKVYKYIGSAVTSLDEIILRSGLTAGAVSSMLLILEFNGRIRSVAGGYVR